MAKSKRTSGHKEIYVKVTPLPSIKRNEFNLSRLKAEYDRELTEFRGWNMFSGGGVGASIGLVACLASSVLGIPVTSPEAFSIVGGSLLLGVIAGFILY